MDVILPTGCRAKIVIQGSLRLKSFGLRVLGALGVWDTRHARDSETSARRPEGEGSAL